MSNQSKLLGFGHKPVFVRVSRANYVQLISGRRAFSDLEWQRLPTEVEFTNKSKLGIYFEFPLDDSIDETDYLLFSYVYPFNLNDIELQSRKLLKAAAKHPTQLSVKQKVLVRSIEGRSVKLLTVTSPEAPLDAPVIFLTSRVHSGETPASYMLQGVLNLLSDVENP
jgi:hypothetical protein